MDKGYLELLLSKHKNGSLSESERIELDRWYLARAEASPVLKDSEVFRKRIGELHAAFPFVEVRTVKKIRLWPRLVAAASIVVVLGAGLFYYNKLNKSSDGSEQFALLDKVAVPGGNKAYLTLSNGRKIVLDDAANGELAKESGIVVSKTADGQLVYTANNAEGISANKFNEIETPRGGQYQIVLPDGSKVWLNAMSSLRYPVQFASNERVVELKGEGYFEVEHNASKPFRVRSLEQTVEVLGTHFNVNGYKDEGVFKTTLLEGSVKVSADGDSKKIIPGEQSLVNGNGIEVSKGDTELAVAWKNNEFMFDNQKIGSIMKMIERWYEVEVVYNGELPKDNFFGTISRFDKISKVLAMLEKTGRVHFKVEGKKVFVSR